MTSLKGKVAIVLGAAGKDNMGQVIARRLADAGATVVLGGRGRERMSDLAVQIGGMAVECDITNREQVFGAVKEAKNRYGRVDIGVNATGWGLLRQFEETTQQDLDRICDIQFKGPFYFFQALVGAMEHGGSIVQISSATATIMLDHHAAYMGTKAGTDHVLRTVANEYGAKGVRANSISPGVTATPMAGDSLSIGPVRDAFIKEYPLGRIGTSDDIANACLWLCSDECFMTGQNLQVNGGLTLRRNPNAQELFSVMPAEAIAHLTA